MLFIKNALLTDKLMDNMETNVIKPPLFLKEGEDEQVVLSSEVSDLLDSKINSIREFISNNDGKGKDSETKDKLYGDAQVMWVDFTKSFNGVNYSLHLSDAQSKFLLNLLNSKLEYDTNTVFIIIELMGFVNQIKSRNQNNIFEVSATQITYVYHLISQYKVKGITDETYHFADILRKIGHISKIVNYYDNIGKELSTEIMDWVSCFEEGVDKS